MLVSIVIPTRNRCDLLRETMASVYAQTYADWEAIIVDDGSTDGTEEMVKAMAATERRLRYLRRQRNPQGASTCRNLGITAANGEYIIFLDSDDLLAPTCLEGRIQVMKENPKLDFVVFLTQVFREVRGDRPYLWNTFTQENDLDRLLRRDSPWQTTGPLWKKASLALIGEWDERALSAQDWEFNIRAIAAGLTYEKIPEIDSYWRDTRAGSISNSWGNTRKLCNRVRLHRRIIEILRAKGLVTRKRQRILMSEYYKHAFVFNNSRRLAHRIWARGRRDKVIGRFEYNLIILGDILWRSARRLNEFMVAKIIPETRLSSTHTVALLAPTKKITKP